MARQELLYLIYGKETPFIEGRYSIISAFAAAQTDLDVTVITDRPEAFAGFPIHTIRLDPETQAHWLGSDGYIHRRKTCAIISRLPECEKLIFVDADTIFLAPPHLLFQRVASGQSLLHCDEGDILQVPVHSLYADAWRQFAAQDVIRFGPVELPAEKWKSAGPHMWNSGILGIHTSDSVTIHEALVISDTTYGLNHGHTSEQFAVSVTLFNRTKIHAAHDLVEHYWPAMPYPSRPEWKDQRAMYDEQAAAFFETHAGKTFDQLVQAYRRRPARLFRITPRVRLMTAVHRRAPRQPRPIQLVLRQLGF